MIFEPTLGGQSVFNDPLVHPLVQFHHWEMFFNNFNKSGVASLCSSSVPSQSPKPLQIWKVNQLKSYF